VALDAMTGAFKTSYPLVQRDFHDWDVSAAPAVFTTKGGVRMAAEAIKDGHAYGLDTASGKQLWRTATTTILNPTAPLTAGGTHFCPGTQGGSEWNGAAYSPATNFVYVGAVDWCDTVKVAPDAKIKAGQPGKPWSGSADEKDAFGKLDPQGHWAGWVNAIDADTGKIAWKRKLPAPVLGAVTPTAGGVVFAGDMEGHLFALDARTGATVWSADAGGAVGGGIVSYSTPAGDQRIAVAAGMTSPIWPTAKVNARLVVYGLK
jgi:glucose dehydrogenase